MGADADGHLTATAGVLLAVTVADCVPVFLVDPGRRAVGLLHAGWRGVVAGVMEEGVQAFRLAFGTLASELLVHLGPAICGSCYEVGPEVHDALGLPKPDGPTPVDLRRLLAAKADSMGVDPTRISVSSWCTRCDGSPFFSHRRGDTGRQVAFVGIRAGRGWGGSQARPTPFSTSST